MGEKRVTKSIKDLMANERFIILDEETYIIRDSIGDGIKTKGEDLIHVLNDIDRLRVRTKNDKYIAAIDANANPKSFDGYVKFESNNAQVEAYYVDEREYRKMLEYTQRKIDREYDKSLEE